MPLKRIGFPNFFRIKGINFLILMLFIVLFTAGCATQHKHKKIKAVPCPCLQDRRR
jgi:hypothetical protein